MTAIDDRPAEPWDEPVDDAARDLSVEDLDRLLAEARTDQHADGQVASEDVVGATWQPRDLATALEGDHCPRRPAMLLRTDGRGLFYEGTINGVHSDSGTGKGWVALAAGVEHVLAGGHLWWIDFEDPSEHLLVERLRELAVPDTVIATRIHYVNPDEPATPLIVSRLRDQVDANPASLAVIDSVGEALGLQGLDENKDLDVDLWKRLLPHELERAGHTVAIIDHATKAGDNPLYPSGSKRKRALISGAAWSLELVTPFDREHPGKLKAICAKDRHGNYRRGETGAWIHIDSTGPRMHIVVEAPTDTDSRPADTAGIVLIRPVIGVIKAAGPDGINVRGLRAAIRARHSAAQQAIDDAVELASRIGAITITDGQRGARIHHWNQDPTDDQIQELTT